MKTQIAELSRKLGYGNFASDGIKAVLGKHPINLSDSRAADVLVELKARYAKTPAGIAEAARNEAAGWIEDAPMHADFARKYAR
jgi:hypothetical protein